MTETYYCAECAKPIEVDTDKEKLSDVALCDETALAKYVWGTLEEDDEDEPIICCSNECEFEYYLREREQCR